MKVELQLHRVLKRELKNLDISINQLAVECSIPVSILHGWLHGTLPSARSLPHIATLAQRLGLPVSVLLFNRNENTGDNVIVMTSEFDDGEHRYRLLIEKLRKVGE